MMLPMSLKYKCSDQFAPGKMAIVVGKPVKYKGVCSHAYVYLGTAVRGRSHSSMRVCVCISQSVCVGCGQRRSMVCKVDSLLACLLWQLLKEAH